MIDEHKELMNNFIHNLNTMFEPTTSQLKTNFQKLQDILQENQPFPFEEFTLSDIDK